MELSTNHHSDIDNHYLFILYFIIHRIATDFACAKRQKKKEKPGFSLAFKISILGAYQFTMRKKESNR